MLSEIASFCSGILASVLANELGDLTHNKVDDKKKQKLEIKTLDNIEKQVKDLFEQEHVREWLFEQQYEIEQVGCLFSEEEKEKFVEDFFVQHEELKYVHSLSVENIISVC